MKFDTIIIGGGLSGLVCGLELQRHGVSCAIVSAGQNAMHFSSGALQLLSYRKDGSVIEDPLAAMEELDEGHPYSKIGPENMRRHVAGIKEKFRSWGIDLQGRPDRNGWQLTHLGQIRPAWLGFEDTTLAPSADSRPGRKALIVNFDGYLDFHTAFLARTLERLGTEPVCLNLRMQEMERLRTSATEMRSVNIARVLEDGQTLLKLTERLRSALKDEDVLLLPAVFGIRGTESLDRIRRELPVRTIFIGTMPPSVPGIRTQMKLKDSFVRSGGRIIAGDTVREVRMEQGRIRAVRTANLDDYELEAGHFILATGTFFSRGLRATPHQIVEPLLNLDIDCLEGRENWYDREFFKSHRYLGFGVRTDREFRPSIAGKTVENLHAVGSILSGFNPIDTGCGGGVSVFTAIAVAEKLIKNRE